MDRKKLVDAILAVFRKQGQRSQEQILNETLRRVGDMDLIVLAQELDIDTDALFTPGLNEALAVEQQIIAKNNEVRS